MKVRTDRDFCPPEDSKVIPSRQDEPRMEVGQFRFLSVVVLLGSSSCVGLLARTA